MDRSHSTIRESHSNPIRVCAAQGDPLAGALLQGTLECADAASRRGAIVLRIFAGQSSESATILCESDRAVAASQPSSSCASDPRLFAGLRIPLSVRSAALVCVLAMRRSITSREPHALELLHLLSFGYSCARARSSAACAVARLDSRSRQGQPAPSEGKHHGGSRSNGVRIQLSVAASIRATCAVDRCRSRHVTQIGDSNASNRTMPDRPNKASTRPRATASPGHCQWLELSGAPASAFQTGFCFPPPCHDRSRHDEQDHCL